MTLAEALKGVGLLNFFDEHATYKAAQMNGTVVMGREMRVDYATNKPGSKPTIDDIPPDPRGSPMPYNTQAPYVPVPVAQVPTPRAVGPTTGVLTTPPTVTPTYYPTKAPNKIRNVNAEPQRPRPPGCKTIFIGNLSDQVDDNIVLQTFAGCGNIKEIRWLNEKATGRFKGCGFVEFFEEEATIKAAALNGTLIYGRPMRVDFSAPPKGGA